MCGQNELYVREVVSKQPRQLLLPERMQMRVELVNEHDGRLFENVIFVDVREECPEVRADEPDDTKDR